MSVLIPQPNPLTDPILPAIRSYALAAAGSLGLFAAIPQEGCSAAQLAESLDLNPIGVKRLAGVLVACGYLSHADGKYQLTEVSRMALVEGGLTNWVAFCKVQLQAVSQLESALVDDKPVDLFGLMGSEAELLTHQRAMAETARPAADWIAANVQVKPGATAMLDIGGSHGLYSAAVCQLHPPLKAEILELPAVIEMSRAVSREYETDQFVRHIEGDIVATALSRQYEVVFLGNIIHHLPEADALAALKKIAAHTVPGGTIAIWDVAETDDQPDEAAACFSLFFYLTSGAKCYSEAEITAMLQSSGFGDVQARRPPRNSTHVLFTACKW